jgi:hypothetical protein
VLVKGDLFGRDKFVPQIIIDGKLFEQKEPPKPSTPTRPTTGGGPAASVPNIGGSYTVTIDIPGQPLTATLTFVQQGSGFTGTMVSPLGTSQLRDGKVNTEGFTFAGTVDFQGSPLEITAKGSVTGNNISGTIDSTLGAVPFSGTKNP